MSKFNKLSHIPYVFWAKFFDILKFYYYTSIYTRAQKEKERSTFLQNYSDSSRDV